MTVPADNHRPPMQPGSQQAAHRTGLVISPLLGTLSGAAFGGLCILLRAVAPPEWASLADTWWPWAIFLGIAAVGTRSVHANVLCVVATGLSGLAVYYLLKASLALGYPSGTYRGFHVYFQQENLLLWSAAVITAAVPAGMAGAWIRRLVT